MGALDGVGFGEGLADPRTWNISDIGPHGKAREKCPRALTDMEVDLVRLALQGLDTRALLEPRRGARKPAENNGHRVRHHFDMVWHMA